MSRAEVTRKFAGSLFCAALGACSGVPSADPPDFLPTPSLTVGPEIEISGGPEVTQVGPVDLKAGPGGAAAEADVYIVNLDAPNEATKIITPNPDGSFETSVSGLVGDRFRILSRSEQAHSLPLDLEAVRGLNMGALAPLGNQGLPCLSLKPKGELDLGRAGSRSERFLLENGCAQTVTIVSSALRFGTEGFSVTAPEALKAGERANIDVKRAGQLEAEIWDILLLEVSAGQERGRYGLSVWAR